MVGTRERRLRVWLVAKESGMFWEGWSEMMLCELFGEANVVALDAMSDHQNLFQNDGHLTVSLCFLSLHSCSLVY